MMGLKFQLIAAGKKNFFGPVIKFREKNSKTGITHTKINFTIRHNVAFIFVNNKNRKHFRASITTPSYGNIIELSPFL